VELSENITVTGFTIEHLPKSLSPSGTIDTAPREFHVLVSRD
jgi:SUN domain-containing protein 1/2